MEKIYDVLNWISNNILWGIPMIVLILGCGIFLSLRTKFLQVRKFNFAVSSTMGESIKQMRNQKSNTKDKSNISPFEAFATAISGTVGTGNIVGVTTAILSGGPGAVFWMWVSAFFGCATKFAEIVLGLFYRKKDSNGEYVGGPVFYIKNGAKSKFLAFLFALFTMFAAIGMGSVQSKTIESTWSTAFNIPTWIITLIIVVISAIVIIGGVKRIGKVASLLVPFMAIGFIVCALIIICCNITAVPAAFASIFSSAFTTKSMLGGFMGYGIAQAMRFGFSRGVFSNEAGLGSSSIAHSTSTTKEPVKQGMWGVFELFVVTFVVCTLTALLVLTSGIDGNSIGDGSIVAMKAFESVLGTFGTIAFSIILPLFAFTTILAWAVYGAKSAVYIFKKNEKKVQLTFNIIYLAMILGLGLVSYFFSGNIGADFIWLLADVMNALMAIPNLIALFILSGVVIKVTNNYFARRKGEKIKPMLSAYPEQQEELEKELLIEENLDNGSNSKENSINSIIENANISNENTTVKITNTEKKSKTKTENKEENSTEKLTKVKQKNKENK